MKSYRKCIMNIPTYQSIKLMVKYKTGSCWRKSPVFVMPWRRDSLRSSIWSRRRKLQLVPLRLKSPRSGRRFKGSPITTTISWKKRTKFKSNLRRRPEKHSFFGKALRNAKKYGRLKKEILRPISKLTLREKEKKLPKSKSILRNYNKNWRRSKPSGKNFLKRTRIWKSNWMAKFKKGRDKKIKLKTWKRGWMISQFSNPVIMQSWIRNLPKWLNKMKSYGKK